MDSWQMECCGDPFAVGDSVRWGVYLTQDFDWLSAVLGADVAASIDAMEEHHGPEGETHTVTGVVTAIEGVYCRYAARPDTKDLYPVDGSSVLVRMSSAPRFAAEMNKLSFVGYLVDLDVQSVTSKGA